MKWLCCGGYKFDDTLELCREMEREIILPAIKDPPKDFDRMAYAYVQLTNLQIKMEAMTKEAIFAFFMGISGLMESPELSYADSFRVYLLKFTVFMIRWCPGVEWFLNFVIYKMLYYDCGKLKL